MMNENCLSNKTILITGAAGFIGSFLCKRILMKFDDTVKIIGLDNLNTYYDVKLKMDRVSELKNIAENYCDGRLEFIVGGIEDKDSVASIFKKYKPDIVVHLAAQAGVRYSITHPDVYMESNIIGFYQILEACRHSYDDGAKGISHLIYASSSSVYGTNTKTPYSTEDKTDGPVSLYAATKKSNELMAHAYSKLYDIPCTGLRFFTVYGPMGRPDMAYFGFTEKMINHQKIQLFNHGDMYRDFTYIDDIITGIVNIMQKTPGTNESGVKYNLYNIGNNKPVSLNKFVQILEECLMSEGLISQLAVREYLPMQPGDVYQTYADIDQLIEDFGFRPEINLKEGLTRFAHWYKEYYGL